MCSTGYVILLVFRVYLPVMLKDGRLWPSFETVSLVGLLAHFDCGVIVLYTSFRANKYELWINSSQLVPVPRSPATAELARVRGHYAVRSHSRSPISVPIESPYATSCYWIILESYFAPFTRFHAVLIKLLFLTRIASLKRIHSQKPLKIPP